MRIPRPIGTLRAFPVFDSVVFLTHLKARAKRPAKVMVWLPGPTTSITLIGRSIFIAWMTATDCPHHKLACTSPPHMSAGDQGSGWEIVYAEMDGRNVEPEVIPPLWDHK